MTITGHNRLVFTNILVGDVYFCTGQSNMEWPLYLATDGEAACRSAGDSQLRFYTVPRTVSETPSRAVRGVWEACAPRTARQFSAVAYFFGRALRREERVPVGLILCSWSGAPAMAWTSRTALLGNPALAPLTAAPAPPDRPKPGEPRPVPPSAEHEAAAAVAPSRDSAAPLDRTTPAAVYNGMVAPVIPFAIRGIVCCAGEADTGQASLYQTLFSTMIGGWRDDWKQGEIPCLFVQLAPFMRRQPVQQESAWAELREAQRIVSRTTPGLGMAVVLDAGDESDIHPRNKNTVGERLALLARELIYKEPVQAMGPEYESMHVEGANAIVSFRGAGEGLDLRAGQGPTGFTIAGQDGRFVPAPVTVRGDRLVVSSPEVRTPIAVRYGWADNPPATLWNRAGLPASPFRTDTLPLGAR